MSEPLISVVIPNYNYAGFLPDAVRSAADQTYSNKELIVVDDCSSDDSLDVLETLKNKYAREFPGGFRIERNAQNVGAHASLNYGISTARGRYAAVMNADDMFGLDRLERMYDAMRSSGARLAFSDVKCIGRDGEELLTPFAKTIRELPKRADRYAFAALAAVAENIAVSTGNMMMEPAFHRELGGFRSYRYVHDYDFLFRACLVSEPVYVPGTSYLYRIHGDNTFTKLQDIGIAENRLIWLEMYEAVKKGQVSNPEMLQHKDYIRMMQDAALAYGVQKTVMWAVAGTPFGKAISAAMRSKLRRYNKKGSL